MVQRQSDTRLNSHEFARQAEGLTDERVCDAVCAGPEGDGQHVVERATTGIWLWVNGSFALLSITVQILDENEGLVVEDIGVAINRGFV